MKSKLLWILDVKKVPLDCCIDNSLKKTFSARKVAGRITLVKRFVKRFFKFYFKKSINFAIFFT